MVRHLVVDRGAPSQPLIERGRFAIDERFLIEHRDAGMLHSAERKRGREHVLELLKWKRHAEIVLEGGEGRADLRLERIHFDFART